MGVVQHGITQALKAILWLLFVPSLLFALYMLLVGLTFGFALWDTSNPTPTPLWLGVLAAPVLLGVAGKKGRNSPVVVALAILAVFALTSAYLVIAFSD